MWYDERLRKDRREKNPKFGLCCYQGKIELPKLLSPPTLLQNLLIGADNRSKHFLENIHAYNMMFSFTSMGGKIDTSINNRSGPYVFRLHGQNYHRIGSLLPSHGSAPKFAQLYIFDTDNEISNRISILSSRDNRLSFDESVVEDLKTMLDDNNVIAKSFRMAKDRFLASDFKDIRLKLIGRRGSDGRKYNTPSVSEVAGLIVGDIGMTQGDRDIVVQTQEGHLQRISELHPSYLAMQYPLLFPYGEDGYREDVKHSDSSANRSRERLTMREFFAFRIQDRYNQFSTILNSRKLFHQFLVDSYTMVESERLCYIRLHQKTLRAELYKGLADAVIRGETNPASSGKRIILPSSFTGGSRYMIQNYQDAMAICRWAGYPDLFITFTCNPQWPEIQRYTSQRSVKPEDRPDILCRIFKLKLDQMLKDIKHEKIFGRVQAGNINNK